MQKDWKNRSRKNLWQQTRFVLHELTNNRKVRMDDIKAHLHKHVCATNDSIDALMDLVAWELDPEGRVIEHTFPSIEQLEAAGIY